MLLFCSLSLCASECPFRVKKATSRFWRKRIFILLEGILWLVVSLGLRMHYKSIKNLQNPEVVFLLKTGKRVLKHRERSCKRHVQLLWASGKLSGGDRSTAPGRSRGWEGPNLCLNSHGFLYPWGFQEFLWMRAYYNIKAVTVECGESL